jgi:hypothetical protein
MEPHELAFSVAVPWIGFIGFIGLRNAFAVPPGATNLAARQVAIIDM